MDKRETLNQIFRGLRTGDIPVNEIHLLAAVIDADDIPWMMEMIGELRDPGVFFVGSEEGDRLAIEGVFLFVDLVSALIIRIGRTNDINIEAYEDPNATYVPNVIKFVTDDRFHRELADKFGI